MSHPRTPPVTVSPMLAMHTYRYEPLDRWLASVEMKTSPELFIRTPLPDADAMCETYVSKYPGLNGHNYVLSLAVYHPRVAIDHATPDIELARFVGRPDDPGAPIWPLDFMARVLKGMTDIPIGPVFCPSEERRVEHQLCFNNWVRDALAIAPTPLTPKPIRRRLAAVKWVRGKNLRGSKWVRGRNLRDKKRIRGKRAA
ncbi:hypothetical protein B0H12DRAFT_1243510 [Mycena haematopus]|nr:hypothetical protein B0H12DRAFT_1243510 [Mycena haematopus]